MNLNDFIYSKAKCLRQSHTIWWFKDFRKTCSEQALEIKTLKLFFKTILICCCFKKSWMPKFNRSLSTTKLVREMFYITFECFPSYFWTTERTLFCYRCHWLNQYVSQEHDSLYGNKRVFRLSPYLTGLRLFCDSWRRTSRVGRKAVLKQSPVIRSILACVAKWRKVVAKILNMFKNFMRQNSPQNSRKLVAGVSNPSRTCRRPHVI